MNLGIVIILIVISGYFSNWINWRFLNYRITHLLYYIGAFVHETSHAVSCLFTGAKIEEFSVFSAQPHVTHRKSKLPIIGELLISSAPIFGGLLFLFLVNRFALENYFLVGPLSDMSTWQDVFGGVFQFLLNINLLHWQSWVMILLCINVGAMLGPSLQDLKNMWPVLILLCFAPEAHFVGIGLLALSFILVNIVLQIIFISVVGVFNFARR
ncbi:MAG: hypothetical protein AAB511_03350 [Patescibacteria group bacterium]